LLAGTLPVVWALERAGLATLLLKGVALILTVYARPGLRTAGDADVLVEPRAAAEARAILTRLGWRPIRRVAESTQWLRHSQGFVNDDGIRFDLHWHALAECCADEVDREFWQRAEVFRRDALTTRVLSPPDQLLQVAVHGLRWGGPRSELWIADAVAILRRAGAAFDWNLLVAEARRRQLAFQLARALHRLEEVVDVGIPAHVTGTLAAVPASWQDRLEYRAKLGPPAPARLLFLFWRALARAAPHRSALSRAVTLVRALPAFSGGRLRWRAEP
jgi:hypothetical protein